MRTGCHHIDIANCQLYGNRLGILLADAHDVTVSGCSLHNNIRAGIRFAGTTHDVTVSDTERFGNEDGTDAAAKPTALRPTASVT